MATHGCAEDDASSRAPHRGVGTRWLWLVVAAAWGIALAATLTGQRYLIDHHYLLEESGLAWPVAAIAFLIGWQVMIGAMMLPSATPALALMVATSRNEGRTPVRAHAAFLAGYAAMWTAFALLAFAGDTALHRAVDTWPWLAAHAFLIGAATLAGAGAFQFTPLKGRCLAACHDPRALFARSYRSGLGPAWGLGTRFGVSSVGCCWGLMLIMFGIGVGGLGWMMGLTGAMLVEEVVPSGRQARLTLGAVLLLLAMLWLIRPAWLVPGGVS